MAKVILTSIKAGTTHNGQVITQPEEISKLELKLHSGLIPSAEQIEILKKSLTSLTEQNCIVAGEVFQINVEVVE